MATLSSIVAQAKEVVAGLRGTSPRLEEQFDDASKNAAESVLHQ
jgi:hypothetical protein